MLARLPMLVQVHANIKSILYHLKIFDIMSDIVVNKREKGREIAERQKAHTQTDPVRTKRDHNRFEFAVYVFVLLLLFFLSRETTMYLCVITSM